jgi:predicted transcriptional regulator
MQNMNLSLPTAASAALISIHPAYVAKIISGEKRVEFRRSWAAVPVDYLAIYATAPVKRIVAFVEVGRVVRGSKTRLWEISREEGGGITRRKLFAYLDGKKEAVALELKRSVQLATGVDPLDIFGPDFRPPQSFRYLTNDEWLRLRQQTEEEVWD